MASADDVLSILASQHPEWTAAGGKVNELAIQLYLQHGGTAQAAADAIWANAMSYPGDSIPQKLWFSYGGGSHFYLLNTAQALGEQGPDPEPESRPPVYLAEQALEYAQLGWRFDGKSKFLDLATPEGAAAFARRKAFAEIVPPSWGTATALYRYLVLTGEISAMPPDLGWRPDRLWKRLHDWSLQAYLDDEWSRR